MGRVINNIYGGVGQNLFPHIVIFRCHIADTNEHVFSDSIKSSIWQRFDSVCVPHDVQEVEIKKDFFNFLGRWEVSKNFPALLSDPFVLASWKIEKSVHQFGIFEQ